MLPYALKAHLNPGDVEQLKKIRSLYKNGMFLLGSFIHHVSTEVQQKIALCP